MPLKLTRFSVTAKLLYLQTIYPCSVLIPSTISLAPTGISGCCTKGRSSLTWQVIFKTMLCTGKFSGVNACNSFNPILLTGGAR